VFEWEVTGAAMQGVVSSGHTSTVLFFFDNAVQNTLLMFSHKIDCMLKVLETAIDVLSKLLKRRHRFRFRVMVFYWGLWLVFRAKV